MAWYLPTNMGMAKTRGRASHPAGGVVFCFVLFTDLVKMGAGLVLGILGPPTCVILTPTYRVVMLPWRQPRQHPAGTMRSE